MDDAFGGGRDAEDGNRRFLPARAGQRGEDAAVDVDRGVGDGVQVFRHRDADVEVQRVRHGATAGDDELARQHAFRHAHDGTRGPRERDEGGNVADFRRERRA